MYQTFFVTAFARFSCSSFFAMLCSHCSRSWKKSCACAALAFASVCSFQSRSSARSMVDCRKSALLQATFSTWPFLCSLLWSWPASLWWPTSTMRMWPTFITVRVHGCVCVHVHVCACACVCMYGCVYVCLYLSFSASASVALSPLIG